MLNAAASVGRALLSSLPLPVLTNSEKQSLDNLKGALKNQGAMLETPTNNSTNLGLLKDNAVFAKENSQRLLNAQLKVLIRSNATLPNGIQFSKFNRVKMVDITSRLTHKENITGINFRQIGSNNSKKLYVLHGSCDLSGNVEVNGKKILLREEFDVTPSFAEGITAISNNVRIKINNTNFLLGDPESAATFSSTDITREGDLVQMGDNASLFGARFSNFKNPESPVDSSLESLKDNNTVVHIKPTILSKRDSIPEEASTGEMFIKRLKNGYKFRLFGYDSTGKDYRISDKSNKVKTLTEEFYHNAEFYDSYNSALNALDDEYSCQRLFTGFFGQEKCPLEVAVTIFSVMDRLGGIENFLVNN